MADRTAQLRAVLHDIKRDKKHCVISAQNRKAHRIQVRAARRSERQAVRLEARKEVL